MTQASMATHASGGELIYRCLGNNQYELLYTFYRDCSGISATPSIGVQITNACGYVVPDITLNATSNSPTTISTVCASAATSCNGGLYRGLQKWVYIGFVTLPGACTEWKFSHGESSRSSAITTIPSADSYDLFVYAMLNNLNDTCNNSAVFGNEPVFRSCLGQQSCIELNAFDIDGDSLSFQQISPLTGINLNDTLSYGPGYSVSQPIISNPPVTFNSSTGTLCMIPTQADVSVAAILVTEYRNGILIGQIERDLQINIVPCNNTAPQLSGVNGFPVFDVNICAGEQTCFKIYSGDSDSSNQTNIVFNMPSPDITYQSTGGYRDTATVCWIPTLADTLGNPHCFDAIVYDDNCPYSLSTTYNYCITVVDTGQCLTANVENDLSTSAILKIYPQPSGDFVNVDFGNGFIPGEYSLYVENNLGQIIYQSVLQEKVTAIDSGELKSSGVLFACILDKDKRIVKKNKIVLIK